MYGVLAAAASGGMTVIASSPAPSATIFAQMTLQRTTIIRVPPVTPAVVASEPTRWKEKGGPDCIKWSTIAAAMISSASTLDVVLRGGKRYRVKLGKSCQAIDFYSDFYVKATPDGQICRSRDSIYSRAGGECGIDKFRTLERAK
jgi:hypothetical protein